jgi:hypothetical protein
MRKRAATNDGLVRAYLSWGSTAESLRSEIYFYWHHKNIKRNEIWGGT